MRHAWPEVIHDDRVAQDIACAQLTIRLAELAHLQVRHALTLNRHFVLSGRRLGRGRDHTVAQRSIGRHIHIDHHMDVKADACAGVQIAQVACHHTGCMDAASIRRIDEGHIGRQRVRHHHIGRHGRPAVAHLHRVVEVLTAHWLERRSCLLHAQRRHCIDDGRHHITDIKEAVVGKDEGSVLQHRAFRRRLIYQSSDDDRLRLANAQRTDVATDNFAGRDEHATMRGRMTGHNRDHLQIEGQRIEHLHAIGRRWTVVEDLDAVLQRLASDHGRA